MVWRLEGRSGEGLRRRKVSYSQVREICFFDCMQQPSVNGKKTGRIRPHGFQICLFTPITHEIVCTRWLKWEQTASTPLIQAQSAVYCQQEGGRGLGLQTDRLWGTVPHRPFTVSRSTSFWEFSSVKPRIHFSGFLLRNHFTSSASFPTPPATPPPPRNS